MQDGLLLSQRRYMGDIFKRVGMVDCKPLATTVPVSCSLATSSDSFHDPTHYKSLAGALQYLTVTRPDISFVVNQLCQHMHSPTMEISLSWSVCYDMSKVLCILAFVSTRLLLQTCMLSQTLIGLVVLLIVSQRVALLLLFFFFLVLIWSDGCVRSKR